MRTQEEIQRQINGLTNQQKRIPEFNAFGEDNWSPIDAQIDILEGGDYEEYENEVHNIESAAYEAQEWLDDDVMEDLFSE